MTTISCHSNKSSYLIGIKTILFVPSAYRCYMWNMVRISFMASEMSFENVDGRTTTDRRQMPAYTISSPMSLQPTTAVLCPWARHFTPRKYWLITQEAIAPSRHDWKIVDWDVKPQHNQPYEPSAQVRLIRKRDHIWSCCKICQGQPRVVIWINLIVLEY